LKELKQLSNSLDRPYLNQFDHLLPPTKQQKDYDDLFGAPTQPKLPDLQPLLNEDGEPVEEGYYDEEASEQEVKRNRRKKYLPDD
jgi:hypothetical protein